MIKLLSHLSYVAITSPDVEASVKFYEEHVGLTVVDRIDGAVYLRCWGDYYRYSVVILPGDVPSLATAAWRTSSPEALQEAVTRIEAAGVTGEWFDGPAIGRAYRFVGPFGHSLTLHWDAEHFHADRDTASVYPDRPSRRSRHIGAPRQLDHVTIAASDVDGFAAWYNEVLGFRIMARTVLDEAPISVFTVLTTNEKSHDLGVVLDMSSTPGRINHYAFWVDTREDLFQAADVLIENGVAMEYGPSIHGIGEQNFLYFREPSTLRIEMNTGGYRNYVPDWQPQTWKPSQGSNNFYKNSAMPMSMTESFPSADAPTATEEGVPDELKEQLLNPYSVQGRAEPHVFEYFPGNYVWNLAVVATLNNGGYIDEVDRACKPVLEASQRGSDAGTAELYASWSAVADRLIASADDMEARGRTIGAGETLYRASLYTSQAERLQSPAWEGRNAAYRKSIELLLRSTRLSGKRLRQVEVPYEGTTLPGYFVEAERADGSPAPVVIQWNGLDSTKEMMIYSGFPDMLAKRGISTLAIDTPGSGEALRLRGLTARYDTEAWAAACIDWLETQPDVDTDRIGLVGWSLGGYYAPRAAAFEPRIKLVVAWGANHDWAEVQRARQRREGEHPVPHYWDHVRWVWGQQGASIDEFLEAVSNVRLEGVVDKITVPFLITHGANDRQIPVRYAHATHEQAVNSTDLELRIFDDPEGGTEHISLDNLVVVAAYIADWIAERLVA